MISEILFKIVSPMFFRGPGEFSPQARGPFSFARSLILPTPSTLAGCLATSLGKFNGIEGESWEEEVTRALALPENAFLRGPYLVADNDVYIPIEGMNGLLELSKIKRFVEDLLSGKRDEAEKILVSMERYTFEHVGIGLKPGEKVVNEEEGLIYWAQFHDYLAAFRGKEVWIGMDAHGFQAETGKIARLGGEGKITKIEHRMNGGRIYKLIENFVKTCSSECVLLLVSHSFIEPPRLEPEEIAPGVYVYPAVYSSIRKLLPNLNVKRVIGTTRLLGAGYSKARNLRKPLYTALSPGTLIEIDQFSPDLIPHIYNKGLSIIGGKIGYGTFIPVTL